jgi:SAM-dependent methyltransferase
MIRQSLSHLKTRKDALVINVSSSAVLIPFPISPVLSAAKAALHSFTESFRMQMAFTGDCVLEIGAGTGALALQAAVLGASVIAVDLSSAMVARLKQRLAPYPECKALVMDGQALTFGDSTFDAAFSVVSTTLFPKWSGVGRSRTPRFAGELCQART